jgi:hypothetical protein
LIRNAAVPGLQDLSEWQRTMLWLKTSWPVLGASCALILLLLLVPRDSLMVRRNEPRVSTYPSVRCPVLCVRTAGDEAFGGLSILEGLVELPQALLHPITLAVIFVIMSVAAGFGAISPLVIASPSEQVGGWLGRWSAAPSTGLLYTDLIIAASLLGIVVLGATVRALSLGLGTPHFVRRTDLTSRTMLSLVPVNARDVTFADVRGSEKWGWLSHSEAYNDEAIVDAIWRWCMAGDAVAQSNSPPS